MKIIIHGASGRMGQMLAQAAEAAGIEVAAKVDLGFAEEKPEEHIYKSLPACTEEADCLIDFSHHLATKSIADYCTGRKMPMVVCTTAQTDEEKEMIYAAAKEIPVFFSANMSVGVAVTADLARRAAAMFPDADIEIVEKHHNQKLDVPSGTALMLANAIKEARPEAVYNIGRHENGKRTKEEIGIHSLRLGTEVGYHEVIIATGSETITIKHEAESRALFANGALKAAEFIKGLPAGLYTMKELVG